MENEPNHSSESGPVPFPAGLFWCVALLPVGVSALAGIVGQDMLALEAAIAVVPCSIVGGVIFARYRRKIGKPDVTMAIVVALGIFVLDLLAAGIGCAAANLH